jgi:hypothetical protein
MGDSMGAAWDYEQDKWHNSDTFKHNTKVLEDVKELLAALDDTSLAKFTVAEHVFVLYMRKAASLTRDGHLKFTEDDAVQLANLFDKVTK